MKTRALHLFLGLLLFVSLGASAQEEMTLDQILNNYYKIAGVSKMKNVQTIVTYGHVEMSSNNLSRITYLKRPNKIRSEMNFHGSKLITLFDGQKGWIINPFAGSTEPQPMDSIAVASLKDQVSFEGLLYDYKDKGYTATYEGIEDVDGTDTYCIHLHKKDKDIWFYLDTETFIPIKEKSQTVFRGRNVSQETYLSNYQQIDSIAFPFLTISQANNGRKIQIITDSIKLNVPLSDTLFTVKPKETENQQK